MPPLAPTDVRIYTTQVCPYCIAAKRLLAARGLAYEEVDVTADPAKRAWLVEATQRRTVPQIFIRGRAIGGYDDLALLDKSGELKRLIAREDPTGDAPPPSKELSST
jgi:glutaredoxin 3